MVAAASANVYDHSGTTDNFRCSVTDDAGNVYVAGSTQTATGLDLLVVSYTLNGTLRWARTFDGPTVGGDDVPVRIMITGTAVRLVVNSYVDGASPNTFCKHLSAANGDVDPTYAATTFPGAALDAAQFSDTYLDYVGYMPSGSSSYARFGEFSKIGPGTVISYPNVISFSRMWIANNAYYLTGVFNSGGSDKTVVAKLASNGGALWSTELSGAASARTPASIKVDAAGNIWVAGTSQQGATGKDFFVTKLDGNGVVLNDVFINRSGNSDEVALDFTLFGGVHPIVVGSSGQDAFVAVLRSNLTTRYTILESGTAGAADVAAHVCTDIDNAYIAVNMQNTGTGHDVKVIKASPTAVVGSMFLPDGGTEHALDIVFSPASLMVVGTQNNDAFAYRINKNQLNINW